MAIRRGSQCVCNTRYHLVWAQKSPNWVLQGRGARTSLRAPSGDCPTSWVRDRRVGSGSGSWPPVFFDLLSDARTPLGKRRVSARQGWAGRKSDFFSNLLECLAWKGVFTRALGSAVPLGYLCQKVQDRFIPSYRPYSGRTNHSRQVEIRVIRSV
jgi:hypothetical protein